MKLIPQFDHHYVTEDGQIINKKTGVTKKLQTLQSGYLACTITEFNKGTTMLLHRALALAYLPNPEDKRTVNHIDGNKQNNCLSNLEWATDAENIKHAYDTGLNKGNSKVTPEHLELIYERFFNGETLTAISKDLPYNNVTVSTHFTKYINSLGQQEKRIEQEKLNKAKRSNDNGLARRSICILQMIDIGTSEVIKTFNSIAEAKHYLNKKSSGPISNTLSGRQNSGYGYKWVKL